MERRALIAVVISLAILVLYQEVVIKRFYPPTGAPSGEPSPREPAPRPPEAERIPSPEISERPKDDLRPAVAGRDVVVETDLYRAVFTTAGGRLKSFTLHRYRTSVEPGSPPLDLILHPVADDLPLGIELRGKETSLSDRAVPYEVDRDGLRVNGNGTGTLTFAGSLDGSPITKRLEVRGNSYLLGLDIGVQSVPEPYSELAVAWHEGLPSAGPGQHEVLFDNVLALQANKLHHKPFADLEAGAILQDDIVWVGFSGQYFLAAMVPEADERNPLRVWMKRRADTVETQLLLPPADFSAHLNLYLGPKEIGVLDQAGHSLRRAVDLGWFTFVALPLLQALRFSHRITGNYGLDIILLTIVIKILFFPLTKKSLESMREMQKLQPQMTALRERFKDKPEQMNKEIMELYRRHKVNPLGGCLPMVLQIPVFIGLYQGLLNAVELRHAPFLLWINDLSAPDRLGSVQLPFVQNPGFPMLTLLMGGSMFAQQWMTPTTADPAQQRIMMIMPVMFTFMFINFPSGLTLYWLVNNILTIGQQVLINRAAGAKS
jgi:YidC/Oxa1 family membrane protein insertase